MGAVDQPVEPQAVPPARWAPRVAPAAQLDRWAVLRAARVAQPARWARPVVLQAVALQAAAGHRVAVRLVAPWVEQPAAKAARPAGRMVRKAVVAVAAAAVQ